MPLPERSRRRYRGGKLLTAWNDHKKRGLASAIQLAKEPRSREAPVAAHRSNRHIEHVGGLLEAEAPEESELDHPALPRVEPLECLERIVERLEVGVARGGG